VAWASWSYLLLDDRSETGVDGQMFEIAARNVIDPTTETRKRFSWGVTASNERVESHFTLRCLIYSIEIKYRVNRKL